MSTTTHPPQQEPVRVVHHPSVTTMMAWLSICLLAAAWGPVLSQHSRIAWTSFGLLGLAAALGLDAVARLRRSRLEQSHQDKSAVVHEQRLVKIESHTRSAQTTRDAIRWVSELAQRHRRPADVTLPESDSEFIDRRAEERSAACWMPVDLLPVVHENDHDALVDPPVRLAAFVRNVSSTGIRLCHREPVESIEAVLQVRPDDAAGAALLLTHCWTRPTSDGWYQSGWKLLSVLNEAEAEAETAALSTAY